MTAESERFIPSAEMIRQCRGLLLEFLHNAYPGWLDEDLLVRAMFTQDDSVPPEHTRRDLNYLHARGLAEYRDVPVPTQDPDPATGRQPTRRKWRLTADGVTFNERGKPWAELERIGR